MSYMQVILYACIVYISTYICMHVGISVYQNKINNLRFADDIGLAEKQEKATTIDRQVKAVG